MTDTTQAAEPVAEQGEDRPDVLSQLAGSYETMRRLLSENERLKVQADSFQQAAAMTETENERLRREIKHAKGQRDHYFRAFTALAANVEALGASFLRAVQMAQVHSYGDRGGDAPVQPRQQERERSIKVQDVPGFMKKPMPAADEPEPPEQPGINMKSLSRAIGNAFG